MGKSSSGLSEAGLRRLREVLARHVESGKIPGLVALVSQGGQMHVEALGTMRHDGGTPMRRDMIFRMASTSSPLSMAAAMVLLDECRLRLDDWDEAGGGRWRRPPAFRGGGGLVSTADDYHAYLQMPLNSGTHQGRRILSRPAVELMTTNRLIPEQQAVRHAMAVDNVRLSFGQGQQGGWGFG